MSMTLCIYIIYDRVRHLAIQMSRGADIESPSKSLRFAFVDSSKRFAAQNMRTEPRTGSDRGGPVLTEREM